MGKRRRLGKKDFIPATLPIGDPDKTVEDHSLPLRYLRLLPRLLIHAKMGRRNDLMYAILH